MKKVNVLPHFFARVEISVRVPTPPRFGMLSFTTDINKRLIDAILIQSELPQTVFRKPGLIFMFAIGILGFSFEESNPDLANEIIDQV